MSAKNFYPNNLFETEQQRKDKQVISFLQGLPMLVFTDTGEINICKRFDITPDQLEQYINIVKENQATNVREKRS